MIENALGFIFGAPGCGKSFIAIGQALSIACGLDQWWNRKINRSGPVIYISSEGVGDMKFRLRAWETALGVKADDAPFYLIRQSINFMDEKDVDKLIRTVQTIVDQTGEFPVAVYVDTVSRVLPGADENLQKDMTLFIRACDALREIFSATVTGVHHTSRAGNLRGSSVFDGAGDFLLLIEREQGEKIGYLTARKIKAAQDGWKQAFEMIEQSVGDIKGTTSLFARACDEPTRDKAAWPDKATCRTILEAIRTAWSANKPWSSMPQSRKQGRYAAGIIKQQFDIVEKTADLMIQTWLQNGVLSYEMCDRNTKMQGLKVTGSID
jgi:predicted ATP-dependent serine protease